MPETGWEAFFCTVIERKLCRRTAAAPIRLLTLGDALP